MGLRRRGDCAPGTTETLTKGTETLTVRALPAIHARGVMGALLPPVMGSLLEHRVDGATRLRLYVSGDTLTGDHISEIARREPDIDVAVMHLGGTRVLLHTVTMDAGQGVDFLTQAPTSARRCPCTTTTIGVFRSPAVRLRTRDSRRRPRRPGHVRATRRDAPVGTEAGHGR